MRSCVNLSPSLAGVVAITLPSELHSTVPLRYGFESGREIEETSALASPLPTTILASKRPRDLGSNSKT